MPDIIALIAPQNVLPTLNEAFSLLGMHENHVALAYGQDTMVQTRQFVLETPVQNVELSDSSRWVIAAMSQHDELRPLIYQQRLAICAVGRCDNHADLAKQYQLDRNCSLNQLLGHLIFPLLQQGYALSDALAQIEKYLVGRIALVCQDLKEAQHGYALNLGHQLFIGLEAGLKQLCTTNQRLIQQVANPSYEIRHGEIIRFGLNTPALCRFGQEPEPLNFSSQRAAQLPHHMLAEIESQPLLLTKLAERYFADRLVPMHLQAKLAGIKAITLVASGSSYHAALIAAYWFESIAGLQTHVEIASEYRFRDIHPHHKELLIAISQSGETADTVESVRHAQMAGHPHCLAICNVLNSTLSSLCDFALQTESGPELSVSSTKSFTAQLAVLFQLAVKMAQANQHLNSEQIVQLEGEMKLLPSKVQQVLEHKKELRRWAGELQHKEQLFVIGRHSMYPVALEGAFKFKEVAYQHANGIAAGELKHGPITLVNDQLSIIACVPWNAHTERMLSNLQEIRSNRGELFVLSDGLLASADRFNVIRMPTDLKELAPITFTVALQLLAYYTATLRGNPIDTPRNLSKSFATNP